VTAPTDPIRRRLGAVLLVAVPLAPLVTIARAGTARKLAASAVAPPGSAKLQLQPAAALQELRAALARMSDLQTLSNRLRLEYARIKGGARDDIDALQEKLAEIDATIEKLKDIAAKIERIAEAIAGILPQVLAYAGTDAGAKACNETAGLLRVTGYIEASQQVAISALAYSWTTARVREALARGRVYLQPHLRPLR